MATSNFKFLGYVIPEASLEIKDPFFISQVQKNEINVDIQHNFLKENNRFVEVVIRIKIKNSEDSFRISLTIKGGFEASKDMDDDKFKQMYRINAPAVLFPYARAYITTLTAQAGIPPVIIPLMNFVPKEQITTQENKLNV